jgi:hypothetical protein
MSRSIRPTHTWAKGAAACAAQRAFLYSSDRARSRREQQTYNTLRRLVFGEREEQAQQRLKALRKRKASA